MTVELFVAVGCYCGCFCLLLLSLLLLLLLVCIVVVVSCNVLVQLFLCWSEVVLFSFYFDPLCDASLCWGGGQKLVFVVCLWVCSKSSGLLFLWCLFLALVLVGCSVLLALFFCLCGS